MRLRSFTLVLGLYGCASPPPKDPSLDLKAIRQQYRAFMREELVLGWYTRTQGETPINALLYLGRERLFSPATLAVIDDARRRPGLTRDDSSALRFLRRALANEQVSLTTARFDDKLDSVSAATKITVPFDSQPIAFNDVSLRLTRETDPRRRALLDAAAARVTIDVLNPILREKEVAAQAAARKAGYTDYVAMGEELRDTRITDVLAQGVAYLRTTDSLYRTTMDRAAHEELGVGLEKIRAADLGRIFASPSIAKLFPKELQLPALTMFLAGIGLDLKTVAGTDVKIDDSLNPLKAPRAFVMPVDPPVDVRLSVKPQGGYRDLAVLLHEAGHAVHAAHMSAEPWEHHLLGHIAATEGFGEFFHFVLGDPRFLMRYKAFLVSHGKPAPSNSELATVLRRAALEEMYFMRRYAFAKQLFELRLHGHPAAEVRDALALLPAPDKTVADDDGSLRALYGQAFSRAYGFTLTSEETARFRSDVDDMFYSADYSRAYALADMMHEAMRKKFGVDWYGKSDAGKFLADELFSHGTSLSVEDVAEKLGYGRKLDFQLSVRRAREILASADSLERLD